MFPTSQTPKEILGPDYDGILAYLKAYQTSGANWDDFARKIDLSFRERMARKLKTCRLNGFYSPRVEDDELIFETLVWAKRKPYQGQDIVEKGWLPE